MIPRSTKNIKMVTPFIHIITPWIWICLISSTRVYGKLDNKNCSQLTSCNAEDGGCDSFDDSCTCRYSSYDVAIIKCNEWSPQSFTLRHEGSTTLYRGEYKMSLSGLNITIPINLVEWFVPKVIPTSRITDFNLTLKLEHLDLSNNNLSLLPEDFLFDLDILEFLDLSHNSISDVPQTFLHKNLKFQNAYGDSLKIMPGMFNDVTKTVDISFNNITTLDEKILLEFHHIRVAYEWIVRQVIIDRFGDMNGTSLKTFKNNLLCEYPKNCPAPCRCYVDDLERPPYVSIVCDKSSLTHFPEVHPYGSAVAIHLNLAHNNISTLPEQNDQIWPHITILDLSNNQLTSLNNINFLSNLTEIRLANNPWKCDCEMICCGFYCHVTVILFNKHKSEIFYYLFSKGICLKFVSEEDIDADKVYAFVSYSCEDEDWIVDFLVPGLETGIPSYKLCLHNRDWRAGQFITDQIVQSVESSRRTIIVLTDNYLKSNWSRLEFDIAYQQALKDQVRRVIAVVPNEVPDLSKIDKEFKSFITLTTYVEAKKPYFWRKLRASMPRTNNTRRTSNTRTAIYLNAAFTETADLIQAIANVS
uniref:TIR domain-containing protein n=1 Tax=Strigamia maritima TaxID=126957 RepID=T1JNH1_STRMM